MNSRKPEWLRVKFKRGKIFFKTHRILKSLHLHTVCEEARCPNIGECWSRKTATFMILGDTCTRNCGFCAVSHGKPLPPDPLEPERVAEAAAKMGLKYVVITSVTRDDLPDGGAHIFSETVRQLRKKIPKAFVEILIPDFHGKEKNLSVILENPPDVLSHNIETVRRLYPLVKRPKTFYYRSLEVLRFFAEKGLTVKSGIMVGLGESMKELEETFGDLLTAGAKLLTIGQYLQPTRNNVPVEKFYTPAEFADLERKALKMGFRGVMAGPLVRSSYMAEDLYQKGI